jgi:hypothetical protein
MEQRVCRGRRRRRRREKSRRRPCQWRCGGGGGGPLTASREAAAAGGGGGVHDSGRPHPPVADKYSTIPAASAGPMMSISSKVWEFGFELELPSELPEAGQGFSWFVRRSGELLILDMNWQIPSSKCN